MADVKWIKITTDIFDDEKILLIESLPDAYAIITVWFKLLCLAGKQNNSGVFMMGRIPYTDKMLATIFRMKESTVTMALQTFEQFEMIEIVDGVITIPNWNKHQTLDAYEKKKERDRLYQQERRANQRALVAKSSDTSPEQSSDIAISDKEEEKDKEIESDIKKKRKKENTHTLFERLLPDYIIPETLKAKMAEWITYKVERKEEYVETGMKVLLRRVENNSITYGEQAVCALIDESMSNGWKGIIFEKLEKKKTESAPSSIPRYSNFDVNEAFEAAVARSWEETKPAKTAADDPELRKRAEALRQRLK